MRVIAGTAGGRKLKGPETDATRPMTDRTREAIFNSLNSAGVLQDAAVVDCFAGTGALGIEAMSRGAKSCTFVDRERKAIDVIKQNLETVGFAGQSTVLSADVMSFIKTATHFDLAFVAPPYVFDDWEPIFSTISTDFLVCESDRTLDIPDNWSLVRLKSYGKTQITMLEPLGEPITPEAVR